MKNLALSALLTGLALVVSVFLVVFAMVFSAIPSRLKRGVIRNEELHPEVMQLHNSTV